MLLKKFHRMRATGDFKVYFLFQSAACCMVRKFFFLKLIFKKLVRYFLTHIFEEASLRKRRRRRRLRLLRLQPVRVTFSTLIEYNTFFSSFLENLVLEEKIDLVVTE